MKLHYNQLLKNTLIEMAFPKRSYTSKKIHSNANNRQQNEESKLAIHTKSLRSKTLARSQTTVVRALETYYCYYYYYDITVYTVAILF